MFIAVLLRLPFLDPPYNERNKSSDLGPDSALPKSAACFDPQLTASRFFFLRLSFDSVRK
jgi:hypothetical protein